MSKSLFVEARGGVLYPADPWSAETIDKMEQGVMFRVDLKTDRKHGTLRHWWAGLAYQIERWEGTGDDRAKTFPSSRKLHEAILIYLGYSETWYHLDGSMQLRADSIRFEAMDEAEFTKLFEKARVLALDRWGMDPWEEWKEAREAENPTQKWQRNWRPGDR